MRIRIAERGRMALRLRHRVEAALIRWIFFGYFVHSSFTVQSAKRRGRRRADVRAYRSCAQVMSYEAFRELLGVPPDSYERGLDFQRKVVDMGKLEVNGLSDIGVDIKLRRRHARAPIHEVAISWWRKEGDAFRAAHEERQRSKVGRMARLRGEVESVQVEAARVEAERDEALEAEIRERLEAMRALEKSKASVR